jgi:hypothetical protein
LTIFMQILSFLKKLLMFSFISLQLDDGLVTNLLHFLLVFKIDFLLDWSPRISEWLLNRSLRSLLIILSELLWIIELLRLHHLIVANHRAFLIIIADRRLISIKLTRIMNLNVLLHLDLTWLIFFILIYLLNFCLVELSFLLNLRNLLINKRLCLLNWSLLVVRVFQNAIFLIIWLRGINWGLDFRI